jgi:S-adenosylmethionine decarboxylase
MVISQVLAELYDCTSLIGDERKLIEVAKASARVVGATVVGEYAVSYVPHGLTVAVFLAESHIVLTTWPEFKLVLVDVLLCNASMNPHLVVDEIRESLCPGGIAVLHEVPRKIHAQP